jgi:hypothetical protein
MCLGGVWVGEQSVQRIKVTRNDIMWPHGLRRGPTAARLLGLRVRIPSMARMSVCFECCVLSGRGLCVGLITRPEESDEMWFV